MRRRTGLARLARAGEGTCALCAGGPGTLAHLVMCPRAADLLEGLGLPAVDAGAATRALELLGAGTVLVPGVLERRARAVAAIVRRLDAAAAAATRAGGAVAAGEG